MRHRDFITIAILGLILAYGNATASQAPCVTTDINNLCDNIGLSITQTSTTKISHGDPLQDPTKTSLPKPITADDIIIQYKYSGPDGTGKEKELPNNTELHTGDRFTINITVNRKIYLYLFHFDAMGTVTELLDYSGQDNYLSPGTFVLPANNRNFELDGNVGDETIDAIVSLSPVRGLMNAYRENIGKLRDKLRGIKNVPDPNPTGCLAGEACRGTMVIRHIGR
ncbi:hypothetical protein TI04_06650 [Achromatium sp. WMS2]|nr:hypothetical protein TI04_06650 [Achromatium sp. WMS2]